MYHVLCFNVMIIATSIIVCCTHKALTRKKAAIKSILLIYLYAYCSIKSLKLTHTFYWFFTMNLWSGIHAYQSNCIYCTNKYMLWVKSVHTDHNSLRKCFMSLKHFTYMIKSLLIDYFACRQHFIGLSLAERIFYNLLVEAD